MSRKLSALVGAVAVAGGVYLLGGTAHASNMGFKLERNFNYVAPTPTAPFQNLYYYSAPLFNGVPDVATTTGTGDRCQGPPDGQISTEDILCDLFTDRAGCTNCNMSITNLQTDTATCALESMVLTHGGLGYTFNGQSLFHIGATPTSLGTPVPMTQDPIRERGFLIKVVYQNRGTAPTNRSVTVGSHDPSWTGQTISNASGCQKAYIGMPYHCMYQKAPEILCGLAGPNPPTQGDFLDANGDTVPDQRDAGGNLIPAAQACPNGIFDKVSGKQISVSTYDNDPTTDPAHDGLVVPYTVSKSALDGHLNEQGTPFDLRPGDGYLVNMVPGHQPTTYRPPHF